MIYLAIFAFVLALVAVGCAVAAWITSWRLMRAQQRLQSGIESSFRKQVVRIDSALSQTNERLRELAASSPAKLAAEVAELSDAVARLAATQRRFAGKFHADRHVNGADKPGGSGGDELDDDIAAHLALQQAPSAGPGA